MRLGLFSVSYAGLWGQHKLDAEGFIAKAAELGYDSVTMMGKRPHLSPLDADAETMASLRAALKGHGIRCDVIAGYTDFAGTGAAEVPYLEMQLAYVESLAAIASQLDASVVRVFSAYEVDDQAPYTTWTRAVTGLREACDRAASHGATLALQNHHDIGVHTDSLLELLSDIDRPNCKLGFDAWSPALRGEDLYQAALKAAPHTAITTNADYIRLPRYRYRPELVNYEPATPDMVRAVPFGDGFIDYPAFFQGLRDGGFDGIANYEMCSPIRGGGDLQNLDNYAAAYLHWMHQHL